MGLSPALIRRVYAVAAAQTAAIRVTVTHRHKIGRDAFGPKFADPVDLSDDLAPLVEDQDEDMAGPGGIEYAKRCKLSFFAPLEVDHADTFKLPGSDDEWQVVMIEGLRDPDGAYYAPIVWLGSAPANG